MDRSRPQMGEKLFRIRGVFRSPECCGEVTADLRAAMADPATEEAAMEDPASLRKAAMEERERIEK